MGEVELLRFCQGDLLIMAWHCLSFELPQAHWWSKRVHVGNKKVWVMDKNLKCEVPVRREDHDIRCIWSEDFCWLPGEVSSLDGDRHIFSPRWFVLREVVQSKTLLYQEIGQFD